MGHSFRWKLGFKYLWANDVDKDNTLLYAVLITTRYYTGGYEKNPKTDNSYFICKPSVGFQTSQKLIEATWYPYDAARACAENFSRFYGTKGRQARIVPIRWYHLVWWWLTFQFHYQSYDFKDFTLLRG